MKIKIFILGLLFMSQLSYAQSEESLIKGSIDRVFDAMRANDSTLLKTTLHTSCFLKTVVKSKEGDVKLLEEPIQAFIKAIGTKREAYIYDERLLSYDIKIDGEMAVAWTPYEFYVNNQFRHCGVDVFTLMKTAEGWKIIGIVDTRRKNCNK